MAGRLPGIRPSLTAAPQPIGPSPIAGDRPVIAGIRYLNSAPFFAPSLLGAVSSPFRIKLETPTECNDAVIEGTAIAGLMSTAAWLRNPMLVRLKGFEIACVGAVDSILLVGKTERDDVKRIFATTQSATSVELIRQLYHRVGLSPHIIPTHHPLRAVTLSTDAALLIGDEALALDRTAWRSWDLGEWWHEQTGLPMVFAVFALRPDALEWRMALEEFLARSLSWSRLHLDAVIAEWYHRASLEKLGISGDAPPEGAREYLRQFDAARMDDQLDDGLAVFAAGLAEIPHGED